MRSVLILTLLLSFTVRAAPAGTPEDWEGPLLKPVPREEVFEFTRKPTFRTVAKDRHQIAFASKGKCDVTVAIHDKAGKVVRCLVSGVLGPNAPDGLLKNSLEQTVLWNGKNDWGEYVENPEACTARVSLGLSPRFDKTIAWHPNDITGAVAAIGADKDGVYVWDFGIRNQIKMYTHDGEYIRTVFPWPADKFPEKVLGMNRGPKPGGEQGPPLGMKGNILLLGEVANRRLVRPSLPVRNGLILASTKGWRQTKKTYLFGTDGSSRGRSAAGPVLARGHSHLHGFYEHEISPDGVWLYSIVDAGSKGGVVRSGRRCRNAVYRLALAEKGPIGRPYIGEENVPKYAEGSDNRHLRNPMGLACDEQGRLYVSDTGNNRIQVFDCSGREAKLLKTIPCRSPYQLDIHHKTGEIYVHCLAGKSVSVVKFGSFSDPKKLKEWKAPLSPMRGFCLDSWADPPRLWFAQGANVVAFEETKDGLKRCIDFAQKVRKAGYDFNFLSHGYREMITAFKDGYLYYGGGKATMPIRRIDPEEGKKFQIVGFQRGWPLSPDEVVAGEDGYFYIRAFSKVGRFREPTAPYRDRRSGRVGVQFTPADEVPFDYGERITGRFGLGLRGVINVPSQSGGNYLCHGFDVAHNGDVVVLCENNADLKHILANKGKYQASETGSGWIKALEREIAAGSLYDPKVIPGVLYGGQLIFVWDRRGELRVDNLVPSPSMKTCGVRGDRWGNVYVGVGWHPCTPTGGKYDFWGAFTGTLMKFPPQGGKLYGKGLGPVALTEIPKRPSEFQGGKWSKNSLWSFPGIGQVPTGKVCACPQSRFDLDMYGRVFAPRAWRFSTAILDTNGNRIIEIGRYGNADSGRGPDSPAKVKGGIAVAHASFVCTVTDKWLYLNDSGNNRIVRVKLGYAKEERAALQQ